MTKLQWCATGDRWEARIGTQQILVPANIYHQHLHQFLAQQGIDLKTWTHYLRPALQAWAQQCQAEEEFQSNLDYWLTCGDPNIEITPTEKKEQTTQLMS